MTTTQRRIKAILLDPDSVVITTPRGKMTITAWAEDVVLVYENRFGNGKGLPHGRRQWLIEHIAVWMQTVYRSAQEEHAG